jgi:hypothetical protein
LVSSPVATGILLLVDPPGIRRWTRAFQGSVPTSRIGLAAVLCASLWIAFVVLMERNANAECRMLLGSNKIKVAEGPIHDVWYQIKSQGFSVNDIAFSYSYFIDRAGFSGVLFDNPIRDGEYARIYYIGNTIIKIEMKR